MDITATKRRVYGEHLTSVDIFKRYIFPAIADKIHDFAWVDLFAGEGNLILPILENIPEDKRTEFFRKHIFLFDIQEQFVKKCIERAVSYGIPMNVAKENIIRRDTIENYPDFTNIEYPIYHITNPPYLYKGYIPKTQETQKYLRYFVGENECYQDLYQLALMNDLKHGIKHLIYIIPSNFLFGYAVSNNIRDDFLKYYSIKKAIIFEKRIFEYTGTNVIICFFERKEKPSVEKMTFTAIKINKVEKEREYTLDPKNHYRAGCEFDEFVEEYKSPKPLRVKYYLRLEEVSKNRGNYRVEVIDASSFEGDGYKKATLFVNKKLFEKIRSAILFVRTLDTGKMNGRVGLYPIRETFGVDGIFVSKFTYRTHPIQIFLIPPLSEEDQLLLQKYFNLILEYFREKTDSEFLTTYKYAEADYTRKYMGLTQTRKLIQTFPILELEDEEKNEFRKIVEAKEVTKILQFLKKIRERRELISYSQ
ncbi:MAG: N-6 DNA methylase [Candidatus Korarchaeota archaeon]